MELFKCIFNKGLNAYGNLAHSICYRYRVDALQYYPKLASVNHSQSTRMISVLVPLRNEEKRVVALIENLKGMTYRAVEYILYDDDSTDQTASIIEQEIDGDARFTLIRGHNFPTGWKGKPHACYELSKNARGKILLFIDADVTLAGDVFAKLSSTF